MPRIKKPFEKPTQAPPNSPAQATAPWWRPLTSRWGILGLLIFVGLVLRLIDFVGGWFATELRGPPAAPAPSQSVSSSPKVKKP